jgi:single-stranded DNA-binding protein
MSARAIVSGALHKAAEERTSKAGKPFATLTIRENVNGSTRWWKGIAFDEEAIAVLKELSAGAPIAVAGEIDAEIWTPEDGSSPSMSWKLTVDAVLSARRRGKGRPDV